MSVTSTYDEVVEKLVVGQQFVTEEQIHDSRRIQKQDYPSLPLDEVLHKCGHLDESQFAEVRQLAQACQTVDVPAHQQQPANKNDSALDLENSNSPESDDEAAHSKSPDTEDETDQSETADDSAESEPEREKFAFSEVPTLERVAAVSGLAETDEAIPIVDIDEVEERLERASKSARSKRQVSLGPLQQCGRYELVEKIARGGMGVVYKARHPDLDREFAVKVLSDGLDAGEEATERFRREAKAAARLNHPGIVKVYDFGTEQGFPYLVMDFVDGRPLDALVRDEKISAIRSAQLTAQLAQALHHAHKQGLVHRDIKPSNVLLNVEGQPQITDFGIVKELGGDAKLTRTGFTLGSPCYMSPEQALGEHDRVGPKSDVYSLGATLYEMLTGRPPFEGDSIHVIMKHVVESEPKSPRVDNPLVPVDLESICLKAMAKEPRNRYVSARQLALDLQSFINGDPVIARPAGWQTRVLRKIKRNREASVLGVLLCLTIIGFLTFNAVQRIRNTNAQHAHVLDLIRQVGELHNESGRLKSQAKLQPESQKQWQQTQSRIRLSYYRAIRLCDEALRIEPNNEEVQRERRLAIDQLGQNLFDQGQFEFAEFVYNLVIDKDQLSDIGKRREFIQKVSLQNRQTQSETNRDYELELERLKQQIEKSKKLQLNPAYFVRERQRIEDILQKNRAQGEQKNILARADAKLDKGDRVGAYQEYLKAIRFGDPTGAIKQQLFSTKELIAGDFSLKYNSARRLESRVLEQQRKGEGEFYRQYLKANEAALAKAQKTLKLANAARIVEDYPKAIARVDEAYASLEELEVKISAIILRDEMAKARQRAIESLAKEYAYKKFSEAENLRDKGESLFKTDAFEKAKKCFLDAKSLFNAASDASKLNGSLEALKTRCLKLATSASKAIPIDLKLRDLVEAKRQRSLGDKYSLSGNVSQAKSSYSEACRLFSKVIESAAAINRAVTARNEAQDLQDKATRNWASQYAPSFFERAVKSLKEGLGALVLEQFEFARKKFNSASYNFKMAIRDSRTRANSRRKAERAQSSMEEARRRAISAGKKNTFAFKEGDSYKIAGEENIRAERWHIAELNFERAEKKYNKARGI